MLWVLAAGLFLDPIYIGCYEQIGLRLTDSSLTVSLKGRQHTPADPSTVM